MIPVAFDTETHLVAVDCIDPPLVCASVASGEDAELLNKRDALTVFANILADDKILIVGHNIAYDMGVMIRAGADVRAVFEKYCKGLVYDTMIAEILHSIAEGTLGVDPRNFAPLQKGQRYSLDYLVAYRLGRADGKANDEYRLRYAELDAIPIAQWPEVARQYPIDDARNTLAVYEAQRGCRNLHDLPNQAYAAFCLQLGAIEGLNVDGPTVDTLEAKVIAEYATELKQFQEVGFIRDDGSEDSRKVKARVVAAYQDNPLPCVAEGCVEGQLSIAPGLTKTGKPSKAKPKTKACPECDGTGYQLTPEVPLTEKFKVSANRDTLKESGDETLLSYAIFDEQAKIRQTYVPFLRSTPSGKLCLKPNVLVETGRTSYSGVIQQLPRKGGVRECFRARPGKVFFSVDYTGQELVTHAQSCLNILGYSKLAEALNAGIKVHDALAAELVGISYEEYLTRASEPQMKAARQAGKAANFGFPGGMGALKFVHAKRADGDITTVCADGFKYKGLRLCVTMFNDLRCGTVKIREYKDKPVKPTCARCVEASEQLRAAWFARWPENRDYFRWVSEQAEQVGEVTQHVSGRVRGGIGFSDAANGMFQGLASEISKEALRRVSYEQYCNPASVLYGSRTLIFLHDELFGECDESVSTEVASRVIEIMVESSKRYAPDVAVGCEADLMRVWSKGASSKLVNGKLTIWEGNSAL